MNFDDIKKEMNDAVDREVKDEITIDLTRGKANPVLLIRSNMKKEIITQLICIVIFMLYPLLVDLPHFSESVYYIFMFITSCMTMGYIIKLTAFLRKTTDFTSSTKETLKDFIYETKLTLEVYKSFIIAGSLLLPVPVFAFLAGFKMVGDQYLFEKWFLLNIETSQIILLIAGFVVTAIFIYYITVAWTKILYGKYLDQLEGLLKDLEPASD